MLDTENLGEGGMRFHVPFLQFFLNLELHQFFFFFFLEDEDKCPTRNTEELNKAVESEKERIPEKQDRLNQQGR